MPDVLVRNVDKEVLKKLRIRAERNGRSLQNELMDVFGSIADAESSSDASAAARIKKALRGRTFSDSAASLREDRSR
jgi:plasmid stability protein